MKMVEELDVLWDVKVVGIVHTEYEHIEGYIDDATEDMFLVKTEAEPLWIPRNQLIISAEL